MKNLTRFGGKEAVSKLCEYSTGHQYIFSFERELATGILQVMPVIPPLSLSGAARAAKVSVVRFTLVCRKTNAPLLALGTAPSDAERSVQTAYTGTVPVLGWWQEEVTMFSCVHHRLRQTVTVRADLGRD